MFSKKPGSMAFYHQDGFVPAYKQAAKFVGKEGHIGIMPDAVAARLAMPPYKELGTYDPSNRSPWDMYYTTLTAEYVGMLKGRPYIVVAHGIGPMATFEGILDAYRWEFDDKSCNRRGGRISQVEFEKLAGGGYGEVAVIDFEDYRDEFSDSREFRSPFRHRRASEAHADPLLLARLGPRAHEYIDRHASYARQYQQMKSAPFTKESMRRAIEDPFVLDVGDANNLPYWCRDIEDGHAFAHLLVLTTIMQVHHQGGPLPPSWACNVHCHEWGDGVRLLGVRPGSTGHVAEGPDPRNLLRSRWRDLLEPTDPEHRPGAFFVLIQMPDKTWFTQVPKKGARADTYEPEFQVTSIEKIGEPRAFYTNSNYPVPIFRYDLREAKGVLPDGVNAYALVGDPARLDDGTSRETCLVQGYRVTIDHTKRLTRESALANNYDRMMELMKVA